MKFDYNFDEPFFLDDDRYVQYSVRDTYKNSVLYFGIEDNHQINAIMDEMRSSDGHLPMFPEDESEPYDCNGWYNFYVVVEKTGKNEYVASVEVTVVSEDADDNEASYAFTLSDDVQETVIDRLDELCRNYFGEDLKHVFWSYEYDR